MDPSVAWLLLRSGYGRSTASFPETQRGEYDGGERQAFTPVASATSAVGNRQRVGDNYENQVKEVINDDNSDPAHPAIASQLEQLAHRQ